ncbi:hypothetical protein DCC85_12165 [Paenibacillus sp. CAA11]|uniref:iron-sulfur cluster biosynthesis family protein n=1 Tax=Paenibacillus sp. CAA11 TaxID=1532905 RepID=UPI000D37E20C|nr:iron-sulfur cluster biosynthesis family protein [Paenibacillus sp. CAA11]AWB44900.1 hypothetical protein DCC85_12165 [Paenibacillus sp. CAA11]
MQITLDQAAKEMISRQLGDQEGQLRLVYDTEGCGCYGITVLHIVNKPQPHDEKLLNDDFPFWVDPQHAVFYEDQLTLKGEPVTRSFKLSGQSQSYNLNMRLEDQR